MSTFLLNTDFVVRDLDQVWAPPDGGRSVAVAQTRYITPLPWLACFREADLVPCRLTLEDSSVIEMLSPCAPIETALINLIRARPFFERLTGEKILAGEFWQLALNYLKKQKLPYFALHFTDFLGISPVGALNVSTRAALRWDDAGFKILKDEFLTWTDGVRPHTSAELDSNTIRLDKVRQQNALSLDVCALL